MAGLTCHSNAMLIGNIVAMPNRIELSQSPRDRKERMSNMYDLSMQADEYGKGHQSLAGNETP